MKPLTLVLFGAALLIVAVAAVPFVVHRAVQSRIWPQHVFEVSNQPPFLAEDLALTKAKETLTREGLDLTHWQPQRDGRTSAPDGRIDEFAARNTSNSNRLVFAFTNTSASTRFVSVELAGSQVICQSSIGK